MTRRTAALRRVVIGRDVEAVSHLSRQAIPFRDRRSVVFLLLPTAATRRKISESRDNVLIANHELTLCCVVSCVFCVFVITSWFGVFITVRMYASIIELFFG